MHSTDSDEEKSSSKLVVPQSQPIILTCRVAVNESDEELNVSSDDDHLPGPSKATTRRTKRARTSSTRSKAPRKKYVRGKQGALRGILQMPLEIFTEVRHST
jgi:hypothetical protein